MDTATTRQTVDRLLERHGRTYASQAGITLRNKPSPLYQLLVLTTLSATRISADVAAATARELFKAGWRTPQRMKESTWQERVDALGRGGYRRYDESTATRLEASADLLLDRYHGDLRRVRPSHGGVDDLEKAIAEFPGIGPTGAAIFTREVQAVWPEVGPRFDRRALDRAEQLGLPTVPDRLGKLAPRGRVADLASALVRDALDG